MREYGQIQSAFWHSTDCQAFSERAKLLACYLMTGPYTNGVGCFRISDGTIVDDLGWSTEVIESLFIELAQRGFAYRQERVVFMPAFLRWNKIANGNIAKARFSDWEQIPSGTVKCHAASAMLEFSDQWSAFHTERLNESANMVTETLFSNSETRTPSHPIPSHPTPPNLSSPKQARATRNKSKDIPEGFDEFWAVYPRTDAKATAIKAYAKTTEAERRVIATVLPDFTGSWKWVNEPEYIPHATTWLNQRRWEDTPPPKEPPRQAKPTTTAESRQARQLRVLEETTNDPRYSQAAQRQLATERHQARAAAPDHPQPALDAIPGSFEWDPPGVD